MQFTLPRALQDLQGGREGGEEEEEEGDEDGDEESWPRRSAANLLPDSLGSRGSVQV